MTIRFLHEDAEFGELLLAVAQQHPHRIGPALIEKDYWVTHALWALQAQGFELWFKGGTSLSKGFGLVQRFSEDLDLKLEPGNVPGIPSVTDWSGTGTRAVGVRRRFFEALEDRLEIPSCTIQRPGRSDDRCRERVIPVLYPGQHVDSLATVMRPFVQLEVGSARVVPAVERDLDSWVHAYVRHYEDAACVIRHLGDLPALELSPRELVAEMIATRDLKTAPQSEDPAFLPAEGERWEPTRAAHRAIGSLHWGERKSLDEACAEIRSWLASI